MTESVKLQDRSWLETVKAFKHPRVVTMLFLGFSAGVPILLIFSSLSLWLREAGVSKSSVTFFSWAALGYSFKFVWAPLVDKLPIPLLTKALGRRRSWMLLSQFSIIIAILWMAQTDPTNPSSITLMALAAVLLGFSSATQDVVIDAYRIESADVNLQTLMSSTYIAGYRIGMLVAGAGALYLASYFGSDKGSYNYQAWQYSYSIMAAVMLIGVVTTLLIKEPIVSKEKVNYSAKDYLRFLLLFIICISGFIAVFYFSSQFVKDLKSSLIEIFANKHIAGFFVEFIRLTTAITFAAILAALQVRVGIVKREMAIETYLTPILDFFKRYGIKLAFLILALIGFYRVSDIVMGIVANLFYQDLGYSKNEIASVVKTFGLLMTIVGGFLGGLLSVRFGVMKILFLGALLSAGTNLLFMLLAQIGYNLPMLYVVISADNLSAGLASAAFVAFLSSLTNIKFTAMQYALFSSLMVFMPKMLGGYSGMMVEGIGYASFFLITAIIGLPVLVLIIIAGKKLELRE
ncbi:MAG: PAT family beta-lactamase induction signal transducer AmpG [Cocleimonas sp.]|jgi:PAT family beta-lactamase induction signal transducer AmpG